MKEIIRFAPWLAKFNHFGSVVRDLDKAVAYYESLGIGPFVDGTGAGVGLTPVLRKAWGKPIDVNRFRHKVAIATLGPLKWELVQPVEWPDPTLPLVKFLGDKGEGIFHVSFEVSDLDEAVKKLEKKGARVAYEIRYKEGGGAVHLDTADPGGVYLELQQQPPEQQT